jgi:hypothetical protein
MALRLTWMRGFLVAGCASLLLVAAVVLFFPTRPAGFLLTGGVGLGISIAGMLCEHFKYRFGVQNIPVALVGLSIALAVGMLAEPPVVQSSIEILSLLTAMLAFGILWIVRFGKRNSTRANG